MPEWAAEVHRRPSEKSNGTGNGALVQATAPLSPPPPPATEDAGNRPAPATGEAHVLIDAERAMIAETAQPTQQAPDINGEKDGVPIDALEPATAPAASDAPTTAKSTTDKQDPVVEARGRRL